ncbi:MAG: TonB-dependent receptor plug domain-containing protein [Gemmatimonadota bacterium]|nr:TonB-dependent receptor plug domain-containing protein [Gemmatimonadota bacterium]
MRRPSPFPIVALLLSTAGPVLGQQEADSVPPAPVDSIVADRTREREVLGDPRLTWLGDTLAPADTLIPKFSHLPETFPDSLVDPYTVHRPAAWPAWTISGDALLGRGAFSLLDVLQSEAMTLGVDVGGSGLPAYLGSPSGTWTNVQVIVDGVPVGDPLQAAWDLRQIPVEGIAEVAWYPGPQVAAWGGEGTGGVLEITTRRSVADAARSILGFHVGRLDAQAFSGALGRPIGRRGEAFVAANFDDIEGRDRLGDFTRNQLVAKASARFGDQRVELARWSDGLTGDVTRRDVRGDQDQDATTLHLFYEGRLGPLGLAASGWRERHEIVQNLDYATRPATAFFEPTRLPGLRGEGERRGAKARLRFERGPLITWAEAVWNEDEVTSFHPAFSRQTGGSLLDPPPEDDPGAATLVNPRKRTEWAGGAGWGTPASRFAANAAVRRTDYGDAADGGTSWQVEALGRPGQGIVLRASAGKAVRAADFVGQGILESLEAADIEIHPNRAADPDALEEWTGWRGEVAWMRPGWRIAGRAYGGSGDGAFLWAPPSAWLYFDRGEVDEFSVGDIPFNTFDVLDVSLSGYEAEVVAPLPWDVDGILRYRRLETSEEFSDRPLPYVPENQALGQLRYAGRFLPNRDLLVEARLIGRYMGERPALFEEEGVLPAYLVADWLTQATIINFTVYVSFKNLFSTAYRSEDSFFLPQQQWFLGIVWRFRE